VKAKAKRSPVEEQLLELRREQAISDLRFVLSSPEGRRFYGRLLQKANLNGKSFADSAALTAYNEGRRSLAIELMQEALAHAPTDHVLTLTEALELQREDESRRRLSDAQAESNDGD
jgi:hypothetical protein